MVKNYLDNEMENPLQALHGLLFLISSKGCLYAPSHREESTYHSLCYTKCGTLCVCVCVCVCVRTYREMHIHREMFRKLCLGFFPLYQICTILNTNHTQRKVMRISLFQNLPFLCFQFVHSFPQSVYKTLLFLFQNIF